MEVNIRWMSSEQWALEIIHLVVHVCWHGCSGFAQHWHFEE